MVDYVLISTFVVACIGIFYSWTKLQPDETYKNYISNDVDILLTPNNKKSSNNKKKNKSSTASSNKSSTRRSSADTEASVEQAKPQKIVEAVKKQAPLVEAVVEKTVVTVAAVKEMNVKQLANVIKKHLDSTDKSESVLEMLKLTSTDNVKDLKREKNSLEKALDRERSDASKHGDALKKATETMKLALRENEDLKSKSRTAADRARAEVSKELSDAKAQASTFKSEASKLKKELDSFNSNEESFKTKIANLESQVKFFQQAMIESAKQQRKAEGGATVETLQKDNKKLTDQVAELQEKAKSAGLVKKQQKDLLKANEKVDALKIQNQTIEHQCSELKTELESSKKELGQLKQSLVDTEIKAQTTSDDQCSVMTAKIERLESQVSENEKQLVTKNTAITSLEKAKSEMVGKTGKLVQELEEAEKQVSEYKVMLSEIQVQLENTENDVGGAGDSSTEEVKKLSDLNDQLRKSEYETKLVNEELKKELNAVVSLDVLKNALTDNLQLRASTVDAKQWAADYLNHIKTPLESQIQNYKVSAQAHTEQVTDLNEQVTHYKSNYELCQAKMSKVESTLDTIQDQILTDAQQVAEEQKKLHSQVDKLTDENSKLNKELDTHKQAMRQVEAKCQTIQTSFDKSMSEKVQQVAELQQANTKLTEQLASQEPDETNEATRSPASEKWVMLNGHENRQTVQSIGSSESDEAPGTAV